MKTKIAFAAVIALTLSSSACSDPFADTGSKSRSLSALNGINFNGIGTNGLYTNGIQLNGIGVNGPAMASILTTGIQSPGQLSRIQDPEVARVLVACAVPEERTVKYRGRKLSGMFGLQGPEAISGCVLAFVNGLGVHVPVSVRTPGGPMDDGEELAYPIKEGAFGGNLLTGELYACSEAGSWQSSWRADRVCTDGGCPPMEVLGTCSDVCDSEFSCAGLPFTAVYLQP